MNHQKTTMVIDRLGQRVNRDGPLLDGDRVIGTNTPMMLMDNGGQSPSQNTLAKGRAILRDAFDEEKLAGMDDTAARHAVVRQKLGAQSQGKSAAYLDAAWRIFADESLPVRIESPTPPPVTHQMTDAQRNVAQAGIQQALLDHAKGRPVTDAKAEALAEQVRRNSTAWDSTGTAPASRVAGQAPGYAATMTDTRRVLAETESARGRRDAALSDQIRRNSEAWRGTGGERK